MRSGIRSNPAAASLTPSRRDTPPIFIPASAATHEGFRAWATSDEYPENLRASFINQGVLIDMSPEELETHNKVKTKIVGTLDSLNGRLDLGELFSDRTLVTNAAAGLSTEPDGTFVTWASFESGRVRLVPRKDRPGQYVELVGTPDWVLGVVSRGSVQKDAQWLCEKYHRAGVSEYWLVDAQHEEVSFQILRRRRDRSVKVRPHGGWYYSTVFDRSFRLERKRNRMGRWSYTLAIEPA
jgi:Uma2 family endonuclease